MLSGSFPPIPTPFFEGRFSPSRLAENLERWNARPYGGYVVLGSNGEAPLIPDEERAEVIRAAASAIASPRKMIVGAGRESTAATIESVKIAFDLGAAAVLVGVPCYYKPAMTDEVIRDHYLRVADSSPGPVLLYSVPVFTGLPIGVALFASLITHDNVAGIKDSGGDIDGLRGLVETARAAGGGKSVLVGSARILAEALAAGAVGSVLAVACVAAEICDAIARAVREGRLEEARSMNGTLSDLAEAVGRKHGIGGLKAALDLLHMHGGPPRAPLPAAGAEARAEIASLMRRLDLLT